MVRTFQVRIKKTGEKCTDDPEEGRSSINCDRCWCLD